MSSVNKCIIVGNLGRDPEVRPTQRGQVCQLSVATSEYWNDRASGERRERTEWHRVVVFDDKLVSVLQTRAQKGTQIYIEGQLQTRKWTDQQGQDRYSTEIVLNPFKGMLQILSGSVGASRGGQNGPGPAYPSPPQGAGYGARHGAPGPAQPPQMPPPGPPMPPPQAPPQQQAFPGDWQRPAQPPPAPPQAPPQAPQQPPQAPQAPPQSGWGQPAPQPQQGPQQGGWGTGTGGSQNNNPPFDDEIPFN